ncbi:hypothetical protein CCUS01_03654 [Colletotrichum cuscutae]|uniref:Uncharacterized protein n=1 Tax=Colletotrichum cuscutae TaxID=1209917 RepID=A0AAI9Y6A0_9PEZI|nr:hypothetical protein CCUS01_03654 [Colletotrichum cuscutae]
MVSLAPELLRIIGQYLAIPLWYQQATNKKTLRALCRVNKAFRDAFSEFLYAEVYLGYNHFVKDDPPQKWLVKDSPETRHIKVIHFRPKGFEWNSREIELDHHVRNCNSQLRRLLANTPNVKRFVLEDGEFFLSSATLKALKHCCPNLEDISLDLEAHPHEPGADRYCRDDDSWRDPEPIMPVPDDLKYSIADFSVFSGLTGLHLTGLQGPISKWIETIACILGSSPKLTDLSLSLSRPTADSFADLDDRDELYDFLMNLGNRYGDLGHPPLRLESLKLYYPVLLCEDEDGGFDYLDKLTDLNHLQEFRLFNQSAVMRGNSPPDAPELAFYAIDPSTMPNLRQLTIGAWEAGIENCFEELDEEYASQLSLRVDPETFIFDPNYEEGIPDMLDNEMVLRAKELIIPQTWIENGKDAPDNWDMFKVLESCHWITSIGFTIDTTVAPYGLIDILANMKGLKKLSIEYPKFKTNRGHGGDPIQRVKKVEYLKPEIVAAKCKHLTYMRLHGHGIKIGRPSAGTAEFEYLEDAEDAVVGAFFRKETREDNHWIAEAMDNDYVEPPRPL